MSSAGGSAACEQCVSELSPVASSKNNHALYLRNTFLLWSLQGIMCLASLIFITSPIYGNLLKEEPYFNLKDHEVGKIDKERC